MRQERLKCTWTLTDFDTGVPEEFSFDACSVIASDTVKDSWKSLFPSKPCPDVRAYVLRSKEFEKLYIKTSRGRYYRKHGDFRGEEEYGRKLSISEIAGFVAPLNMYPSLDVWGVFIRKKPQEVMAKILLHELRHIEEQERGWKEIAEGKK
jgi:hypothetical protein